MLKFNEEVFRVTRVVCLAAVLMSIIDLFHSWLVSCTCMYSMTPCIDSYTCTLTSALKKVFM